MALHYNKILILTAPSGAGKTSITHYLMSRFPVLSFSISATTRQPRANETHGADYYFYSEQEFKDKIRDKEFAEWEMVYEGKYYGTLKHELERIWQQGKVPILDIDVKGAIHVQDQYPVNTLSIFIEPPSVTELERRLLMRGTESEETLSARVSKAAYEISFKDHFDASVVNDDLHTACLTVGGWVEEFLASPDENISL